MSWFRDHIRSGSWFALVALIINLSLSFGHVHPIAAGHLLGPAMAASSGDGGPQGHHDGDPADLLCPICVAAGTIAHALASVPPTLPLIVAEASVERSIEPALAVPQPPRAAFYSRGPPLS
jgi:hypothetical protein